MSMGIIERGPQLHAAEEPRFSADVVLRQLNHNFKSSVRVSHHCMMGLVNYSRMRPVSRSSVH